MMLAFYLLWYMGLGIVIIILFRMIHKLVRVQKEMRRLKKAVDALNTGGTTVEYQRKFSKINFGKKGCPDFTVTTPDKKYEVSVISFLSTHGRWNIEKSSDCYFIEARRYRKFFYKTEYRSEPTSEQAADYSRESKFSRGEFHVSPINAAFDRQIFLFHPKPDLLTYTEKRQKVLSPGDKICGHEIMYLEDFLALFASKS